MSEADELKAKLCDIGRRLYAKGFAAANEGNLSVCLDDQRVLCTPTMFCKGHMQPEDICTVDMEGNQLAGQRRRTSEVMLHLEIYRQRPDIRAVVHCHPPHATAFAVAGEVIPQCVLPEPDIFLGEVPIAKYETPGDQAFANTIREFVQQTNTIVLSNHGTVSYDLDLERAFWLTEILDAYCRILILARQLGGIRYLSREQGEALLNLRREWGFDDPRFELDKADCNVCGHSLFRNSWETSQVHQQAFPPHPSLGDSRPPAPDPLSTVRLAPDQLDQLAELVANRLRSQRD